jgi:hypothetical protein
MASSSAGRHAGLERGEHLVEDDGNDAADAA